MLYQEYREENNRGIGITRASERTFFVLISMPYIVQSHSITVEALSYVYVQALLAGCGPYTRAKFLDAVNLLGASINITAVNGTLTVSLSCLDTHQEKLKKIVSVMLQKPTFAPGEIKRIIENVSNELTESKEDAKERSLDAFVNSLYTKDDYRYNFAIDDLIKEVALVTKAKLQKFHKEVQSGYWIYTFACDTSTSKNTVRFINTLQKNVTASEGNNTPKPLPTASNIITKKTIQLISIPCKQNIEINIGNALPFTQNEPDYFAFVFGLNVLGKWGGFAGRLMSTVREKEGLTYGIYAKTESTTVTTSGYWRIMTFFAPDKALQGITSTLREIDLIKTKGITESEFNRFKTILETGEIMLGDSLQRNIAHLHNLQTKGCTYAEIKKRNQLMAAVTRDEVNSALKKYLDISKLVIAGAGPIKSKENEIKAL